VVTSKQAKPSSTYREKRERQRRRRMGVKNGRGYLDRDHEGNHGGLGLSHQIDRRGHQIEAYCGDEEARTCAALNE
jgi:hypothetical protein